MSEQITLDSDPKVALKEIAGYLRTVDMSGERAIQDVDYETIGYYQLVEWCQGLLEIADECDRIISDE